LILKTPSPGDTDKRLFAGSLAVLGGANDAFDRGAVQKNLEDDRPSFRPGQLLQDLSSEN
jgi:hypothetical protein